MGIEASIPLMNLLHEEGPGLLLEQLHRHSLEIFIRLKPPGIPFLFGPKILHSTVLKHPQATFFLWVTDHVSHPYKTRDKIGVLYILIFMFLDR
jgi:hypothetical protein